MRKYTSFERFKKDGGKLDLTVKETSTGKKFIHIKHRGDIFWKRAYFSKYCKNEITNYPYDIFDNFCLRYVEEGGYYFVVDINDSGLADRALTYLEITITPNIHLTHKNGTYIVCGFTDETFAITCKKWIAEWKRGDRRNPIEHYSLQYFKCLEGNLHERDVIYNRDCIVPQVKAFLN